MNITKKSNATHGCDYMLLGSYPDFIEAILDTKIAASQANSEIGLITSSEHQKIVKSAQDLRLCPPKDLLEVDLIQGGGMIAVNTAVNEALQQIAGETLPVNTSQSTADVCASASRIVLVRRTQGLLEQIDSAVVAFGEKAELWREIPTLARTCLRDAGPTTMGAKMDAFASVLHRSYMEITRQSDELLKVNLGGKATGIDVDLDYQRRAISSLSRQSGLAITARDNLCDAAQNSDDIGRLASEIQLLASSLLKISKDLRILGSGPRGGLNELEIPGVIPGSSYYSGKTNPTVIETVMQACMQVSAHTHVVKLVLENAELDLNVFEGLATINLLDAIRLLQSVLRHFINNCIVDLKVNEARCRELVQFSNTSSITQPKR